MKVHVLIENTSAHPQLQAEHGLSLLIEACGHSILFDTGASAAFAENASLMGIDLSQVDAAVLSHGHYDHGGGLARFLDSNAHAAVWVSPHAFEPHFNASGRNIGLAPALAHHPRILPVPEAVWELAPGITLHSAATLPTNAPAEGEGMSTEQDGQRLPDDFRHEQYLLIEEAGKRHLITGCSHRGILNIATHFRPTTLIGGFHLRHATPEHLNHCASCLSALPTARYFTGHCTGEASFRHMQNILGARLLSLSTGQTLLV